MSDVLKQLISGFNRFREQHFESSDPLYQQLVSRGQMPKTLVVACCDSRVDPAIVLNSEPGELFVIRNVANIVPPAESRVGHHGTTAALEYGVCVLGVEHIIILGHAHCGGIGSLLRSGGITSPGSFIDDWMLLVDQARREALEIQTVLSADDLARHCEQRALLVSLKNLMTFNWIRDRVLSGRLSLHGWYFDIEQGQLLSYMPDLDVFRPL